jgi:hypothetical protein
MAEPLPDGWVDTGLTYSSSASLTGQFGSDAGRFNGTPAELLPTIITLGGVTIYLYITGVTDPWSIHAQIGDDDWEIEALPDSLDTYDPSAATLGSPFTVTRTAGPYRLGMRIVYTGDPDDAPKFAMGYRLEFEWFADENTVITHEIDGNTHTEPSEIAPGDPPLATGGAVGGMGFTVTATGGGSPPYSQYRAYISGLPAFASGTLDTDGNLSLIASGGDATVENTAAVSGDATVGADWSAAYQLSETLETTKWGTGNLAATLIDSDGNEYVSPHSGTREYYVVSWAHTQDPLSLARSYTLKDEAVDGWNPPDNDRALPIRMPVIGDDEYTPISIVVAQEVSINRPDASYPAPSQWATATSGLTITEAAGYTEFVVPAGGGTVTRELYSEWRNRVGLGGLGTSDPAFVISAYEREKHLSGEDVFSWSTYGFLRDDWTSDGGEVSLTVEGVHLQVTDPHLTGTPRIDGYSIAETAFSRSYAWSLEAGANEHYLDLLFPEEGGPFYYGRVDRLALNLPEGTHRLTRFSLWARGDVYLKGMWGVQVQREDYSHLHLSVDGSFPFGSYGDQAYQDEETGIAPLYGGALRYVYPLTGSGEDATILDTQWTLDEFRSLLGNLEGVTTAYDSAAADAALEDAYGNRLGPELAQWLLPLTGATFAPDAGYTPPCAIVVGSVQIANGMEFSITVNHPYWGALEGVASDGQVRAGAGLTFAAEPAGGGAQVGSGTSDDYGFVVVAPVPADGSASWVVVQT